MKKTIITIMVLVTLLTGITVNATDLKRFDDVKGHWGEKYINVLIDNQILNGYPDGTFKPNDTLAADQFIKMMVCALGHTNLTNKKGEYWAVPYIEKAKEIGLIEDEESFFGLSYNSIITREKMAYIVANAEEILKDFTISFNTENIEKEILDKDEISNEFKEYVYQSYGLGILCGNGDGTFNPQGYLTRAESSSVVAKFIDDKIRTPFVEPEPVETMSIEGIKNDPELSKKVNFEDLTFNEDGTITVSNGSSLEERRRDYTLDKEQSEQLVKIIESVVPVLPEDYDNIYVKYMTDTNNEPDLINVIVRASMFSYYFSYQFLLDEDVPIMESFSKNPDFCINLTSLLGVGFEKPEYEFKLKDWIIDTRYLEAYKVFLTATFGNQDMNFYEYSLDKYVDDEERRYFADNESNGGKTDVITNYQIDYTYFIGYSFYITQK